MTKRLAGLLAVLFLASCVTGGEPPDPTTYAALGDSFSSGEGAGGYDAEPADCLRSSLAWPRLLDADVDLRACSGADVGDVVGQVPGEANTDVTLVTLTVGGNDAGFGDIFEACLLGDCPTPASLAADLTTLTSALPALYTALETAYPNARIVHVGYPRLVPPPGDPVSPVCFWLPPEDQTNGTEIVDAINDAIALAVANHGSGDVDYLDVTDAFADHELCTALPFVTLLGRAHPNAAGQTALAAAVSAAL